MNMDDAKCPIFSSDSELNLARLKISEYFDELINNIDIEAETRISMINRNFSTNDIDINKSVKHINIIRDKFVDTIRLIQSSNLEWFDSNKENYDTIIDRLNINIEVEDSAKNNQHQTFKKFAFFLNSHNLENIAMKNIFGMLIVLDWYLNENQLNLLKYSLNEKSTQFQAKSSILDANSIRIYFIKNILKEVLSKSNDSSYVVMINLNQQKMVQVTTLLQDLSFITENFSKLITNLNLTGLKLKILKPNTFNNSIFGNLCELKIENNQIEELLESNLISNQLKNLKLLSFKSNRLQRMNTNLFESIGESLTSLILSINLIQNIEDSIFRPLSNLKELFLSFNIIQVLSKKYFIGLVNLEILYCDNNLIKEIETDTFKPLKKLRILNLSENKISLPNNHDKEEMNSLFCDLSTLEELNLSCNLIDKIMSYSFYGLTSLKKLSLSANNIVSIETNSFDELISLKELFIDDSCMSFLDENKQFLHKLDKLNFNRIKLKS